MKSKIREGIFYLSITLALAGVYMPIVTENGIYLGLLIPMLVQYVIWAIKDRLGYYDNINIPNDFKY